MSTTSSPSTASHSCGASRPSSALRELISVAHPKFRAELTEQAERVKML